MADHTTTTSRWIVDRGNVIPINDLCKHWRGSWCWCRPTCDEGIWVHHSMDLREERESVAEVRKYAGTLE